MKFWKYIGAAAFLCALLLPCQTARAAEAAVSEDTDILAQYQEYQGRLASIERRSEIAENGFSVVESQIFPIEIAGYGEVSLVPAFEDAYHRLALFFVTEGGQVIYKTDQLETNSRVLGQMEQPDCSIAAVSFRDLDMDGRMDIILITACAAADGSDEVYKVEKAPPICPPENVRRETGAGNPCNQSLSVCRRS